MSKVKRELIVVIIILLIAIILNIPSLLADLKRKPVIKPDEDRSQPLSDFIMPEVKDNK